MFPDRSTGWFDVRSQPVPEGVFVLSIDITERKRARDGVARTERHAGAKVTDPHRRTGRCPRPRRVGGPGQVGVPGDDVPRAPHAAEFDHRFHQHRAGALRRAVDAGADQTARDGAGRRTSSAGSDQRRAGFVEDRSRAVRNPRRAVRRAGTAGARDRVDQAAGGRQGPDPDRDMAPAVGGMASDRRRVEQIVINLAEQCRQVHASRRGDACRRHRCRLPGVTRRHAATGVAAVA